jgi:hypothetical protein
MHKKALAALGIGLFAGLLASPSRALGSGDLGYGSVLGAIHESLQRIDSTLKELSHNVDDQKTVCECRCK